MRRAALLAVLTAGLSTSVLAGTIDQSYFPTPWTNFNTSSPSNTPIGQSFTPSFDGLDFVDLRVVDFGSGDGPGANFEVRIREGAIDGAILGTSQTVLVPDNTNLGGGDTITRFLFDSVVSLTPGNLYVIEVFQEPPTDPGQINFGITAGRPGPGYLGGTAIIDGEIVSDRDFIFAEGLVPEPTSLLLLASGALLALRRR